MIKTKTENQERLYWIQIMLMILSQFKPHMRTLKLIEYTTAKSLKFKSKVINPIIKV